MKNRFFLVLIVFSLFGISSLSAAGDSASFVDLGFSPDGKFYAFAQYGVNIETLKPWAELIIVDVEKNDYVPEGRIFYLHNTPITAGQDGSGILYKVMAEKLEQVTSYGIRYSNQGQPLYIALAGDPAFEGHEISFRDFISNVRYKAKLNETVRGRDERASSSFLISLDVMDGDKLIKKVNVGTPQINRRLIYSNRICRVLISPEGNSIIFVIEMKQYNKGGHNIRYMIEAVRLDP